MRRLPELARQPRWAARAWRQPGRRRRSCRRDAGLPWRRRRGATAKPPAAAAGGLPATKHTLASDRRWNVNDRRVDTECKWTPGSPCESHLKAGRQRGGPIYNFAVKMKNSKKK